MTVRNKLTGSKADKVRYCFATAAQHVQESTANQNAPGCYDLPEVAKGVHFSFEKIGDSSQKTNVFLPTEEALKLFIGLRDSLRHLVDESSENENLLLKVMAERDAWGLGRILGRKSNVAEDLGLK